jgi:Ca2+-binding RTX toxin-like protein
LGDNRDPNLSSNEVDLAKFRLAPGQEVVFDTDAAFAGISSLDTILRVFDAQGNELAVNDDADGLDSRIEFTAPEQGTYVVGISSFANFVYDPNVEGSGLNGFSSGRFILNVETTGGEEGDQVVGTTGDDVIDLSEGNLLALAGDGNDLVDSSQAPGGNLVFGGRGDDRLLAGSSDQLFGEDGADVLNAAAGRGSNRLYGGPDADILIAGEGDFLAGGEGDDDLFAGLGGSTLTGGEDPDLFWVAVAGLPDRPGTLTDFTPGDDLIGLAGLGLGFGDVVQRAVDEDLLLSVQVDEGEVPVATLVGMGPESLSSGDFFFV